jgi:hypothetical protein
MDFYPINLETFQFSAIKKENSMTQKSALTNHCNDGCLGLGPTDFLKKKKKFYPF